MLVAVMGAKGGLGTTTVALHLARAAKAVALDLSDGQLAARLERKTWALDQLAYSGAAQRRRSAARAIKHRATVLFTPECRVAPDKVSSFIQSLSDRANIVMDAGIEPIHYLDELIDHAIILTTDTAVARFHQRLLETRYPNHTIIDSPIYRKEAKSIARHFVSTIFA